MQVGCQPLLSGKLQIRKIHIKIGLSTNVLGTQFRFFVWVKGEI